MAWDDMMPTLLRNVIGDTDPIAPKYTDDQLNQTIVSAAQFVLFRVSLPTPYVLDVQNVTIVPDPVGDVAFVNMVTLKAACMLMKTELRVYGQQDLSIRDGTSAIDLKRDLRTLQSMSDGYCQEFEKAVTDYWHGVGAPGAAIVGPFRCCWSGVNPSSFPYPYRDFR